MYFFQASSQKHYVILAEISVNDSVWGRQPVCKILAQTVEAVKVINKWKRGSVTWMSVKISNKQCPSSACCYICVHSHIFCMGWYIKLTLKAALGVLPWETDPRWLLTVPLRKEYWKRDRERRKICCSDNKLISAVHIAQRGSILPTQPPGLSRSLEQGVKQKRGLQSWKQWIYLAQPSHPRWD